MIWGSAPSCRATVCERRVRSDSVQSDQKSVQEEVEEEAESQEKKLPGDLSSQPVNA